MSKNSARASNSCKSTYDLLEKLLTTKSSNFCFAYGAEINNETHSDTDTVVNGRGGEGGGESNTQNS